MKFGKLFFIATIFSMLVTSCGDDPSASQNPFNPKDQITEERALSLLAAWQNDADIYTERTAHYEFDYYIRIPEERRIYYVAEYKGAHDGLGYSFTYIEGTMSNKLYEHTSYFSTNPLFNNGFSEFENTLNEYKNYKNVEYLFYKKDMSLSLYLHVSAVKGGGFCNALTINSDGFITFKKQYNYAGNKTTHLKIEKITYELNS